MNHSPLPWKLETVKTSCGICHKIGPFPDFTHRRISTYACIYDDGGDLKYPTPELLNNAELIIRSVNSYDDLVRAMKLAIEVPKMTALESYPAGQVDAMCEIIEKALLKSGCL